MIQAKEQTRPEQATGRARATDRLRRLIRTRPVAALAVLAVLALLVAVPAIRRDWARRPIPAIREAIPLASGRRPIPELIQLASGRRPIPEVQPADWARRRIPAAPPPHWGRRLPIRLCRRSISRFRIHPARRQCRRRVICAIRRRRLCRRREICAIRRDRTPGRIPAELSRVERRLRGCHRAQPARAVPAGTAVLPVTARTASRAKCTLDFHAAMPMARTLAPTARAIIRVPRM
jgi:hypothetical protein